MVDLRVLGNRFQTSTERRWLRVGIALIGGSCTLLLYILAAVRPASSFWVIANKGFAMPQLLGTLNNKNSQSELNRNSALSLFVRDVLVEHSPSRDSFYTKTPVKETRFQSKTAPKKMNTFGTKTLRVYTRKVNDISQYNLADPMENGFIVKIIPGTPSASRGAGYINVLRPQTGISRRGVLRIGAAIAGASSSAFMGWEAHVASTKLANMLQAARDEAEASVRDKAETSAKDEAETSSKEESKAQIELAKNQIMVARTAGEVTAPTLPVEPAQAAAGAAAAGTAAGATKVAAEKMATTSTDKLSGLVEGADKVIITAMPSERPIAGGSLREAEAAARPIAEIEMLTGKTEAASKQAGASAMSIVSSNAPLEFGSTRFATRPLRYSAVPIIDQFLRLRSSARFPQSLAQLPRPLAYLRGTPPLALLGGRTAVAPLPRAPTQAAAGAAVATLDRPIGTTSIQEAEQAATPMAGVTTRVGKAETVAKLVGASSTSAARFGAVLPRPVNPAQGAKDLAATCKGRCSRDAARERLEAVAAQVAAKKNALIHERERPEVIKEATRIRADSAVNAPEGAPLVVSTKNLQNVAESSLQELQRLQRLRNLRTRERLQRLRTLLEYRETKSTRQRARTKDTVNLLGVRTTPTYLTKEDRQDKLGELKRGLNKVFQQSVAKHKASVPSSSGGSA